jgi:hypothetical protein
MSKVKFKEVSQFLQLTPNEFFSVMTDLTFWYVDNKGKDIVDFEANPKEYACTNSMTITSEKGDKFIKFQQFDKDGKPLLPSFSKPI